MNNYAPASEFASSDPPRLHNGIDIHNVRVDRAYYSRNAKLAHHYPVQQIKNARRSKIRLSEHRSIDDHDVRPGFSYLGDQRPVLRYYGRHRVPLLHKSTKCDQRHPVAAIQFRRRMGQEDVHLGYPLIDRVSVWLRPGLASTLSRPVSGAV